MTNSTTNPPRRLRARLVSLVAVVAVVTAACVPPGPTTFNLGPLTQTLPNIGAQPASVDYSVGSGIFSCHAGYTPPSFTIVGATITLPQVTIDPSQGTVSIPNVTVNIPGANASIGSATVGCFGVNISTGTIKLEFPAKAVVKAATLNAATGVLTLNDPSVTITSVKLHFLGLSLDFNLPDITVNLPTITVPLS